MLGGRPDVRDRRPAGRLSVAGFLWSQDCPAIDSAASSQPESGSCREGQAPWRPSISSRAGTGIRHDRAAGNKNAALPIIAAALGTSIR